MLDKKTQVFGTYSFNSLFVWSMLLTTLNVQYVLSERTNYISTVGGGVVSAEDGNSSFSCHRSEPNEIATIEIGRYVYTINKPASDSPEPPGPIESTDTKGIPPTSVLYKSNLPADNAAYGVFYCASRHDEGWTVVPIIFLRSNAKFHPAGGRFTRTVNTMDAGVTVEFNRISDENVDHLWRHNGTLNSTGYFATNRESSYTIPQRVQPSDGGVYEIHYDKQRGEARGGLMRLIVRECSAGRHNTSAQCLLVCPSCYNGGICDDKTGQCICPPGFQGEDCLTGCGGNRFGRNCEYRCNYDTDLADSCRGLQVCVPDPYGCSCAPGYKGLDCETACSAGEFGASCTETCHCESGECDRFTGICTGTPPGCLPGWEGGNCQRCVPGTYGRHCSGNIRITYNKTNEGISPQVHCMFEGDQLYYTADPVVRLYRKYGTEDFHQDGIISVDSTTDNEYAFNISSIQSDEIFVCYMSDVNTYNSRVTVLDLNYYALLQLRNAPVITGASNETVTLTWPSWNANTDIGDSPLVGYEVFFKEDTPNGEFEQVLPQSLEPTRTITGLSPDTDYLFGVRAVRPGEGGEGPRMEVTGRTLCSAPETVTATTGATPGQIIVHWQFSEDGLHSCRSDFNHIRIYYSRSDIDAPSNPLPTNKIKTFVDTYLTTQYVLTSLEPYSKYTIYVTTRAVGLNLESPRSREAIGYTLGKASSLTVTDLVVAICVTSAVLILAFIVGLVIRRKSSCGRKEAAARTQPPPSPTAACSSDDRRYQDLQKGGVSDVNKSNQGIYMEPIDSPDEPIDEPVYETTNEPDEPMHYENAEVRV